MSALVNAHLGLFNCCAPIFFRSLYFSCSYFVQLRIWATVLKTWKFKLQIYNLATIFSFTFCFENATIANYVPLFLYFARKHGTEYLKLRYMVQRWLMWGFVLIFSTRHCQENSWMLWQITMPYKTITGNDARIAFNANWR